eukprot:CAMPEP_0173384882 /NCGR_PEP_ID=MMETSP1356-20130122/7483_1 /TAXON_ID=77927 ORGANISM="Hemiselmis virescens, Strain PCC157" /NCGR_SAMPLE_ID=MMETSP1356 /ASSEMBLY_ACC=CAM_ASM_000847 /LENGTH=228 /DNA_ID=CAMNT_0014340465 /DNA_START=175 /DNA_END=857 /DNA_ORIENTATION=-
MTRHLSGWAAAALSALLVALALVCTRQGSPRSVLDENGSDVHGGKRLAAKNSAALNLLSHMMGAPSAHGKHAAHIQAGKVAALKRLRGRAGGGIPPIPPPPHILGALPGQGGSMGAMPPPNPVQEGFAEIMSAWTGAGWWQPCGEVCTAGRTRAEMKVEETFKQFQACQTQCRKTKATQLHKVIARVKAEVVKEGGNPNAGGGPFPGPGGPGGSPEGPGGPRGRGGPG